MTNTAAIQLAYKRKKVIIFVLDHVIEILLIALIIGLTIGTKGFMTWGNWMNILRANSLKGIIAFGMTIVMVSGLIDLSIGSTVGLAGVVVALMCRDLSGAGMDLNLACIFGILTCLLGAAVIGWFHGVFQHNTAMPAFIITLASQYALQGLAGKLSDGFPIANQFPDWFNQLGGGRIGGQNGIPIPVIVLVVFYFVTWFFLSKTTTGRACYAAGGNREAARLSGINVGRTKIIAFIIVQIMAVISGFMLSGQVMSGTFTFGKTWETDVILATVVGGTSFDGGSGTITGTLLGVLLVGVMSNGMTLLNFDPYTQNIVKAVILILAILLSSYRTKVKA